MKLNTSGIIGQSTTLADVFKMLAKVAPTDSTVLVTGESGTGKELLVRALHDNSRRADKPFVPINCGAILYLKANSSGMKRALLPTRCAPGPDVLSWRTEGPFSWTKSGKWI